MDPAAGFCTQIPRFPEGPEKSYILGAFGLGKGKYSLFDRNNEAWLLGRVLESMLGSWMLSEMVYGAGHILTNFVLNSG